MKWNIDAVVLIVNTGCLSTIPGNPGNLLEFKNPRGNAISLNLLVLLEIFV